MSHAPRGTAIHRLQMERVAACAGFVGFLMLADATYPQPEVRESAVEEIMPGIFVRGASGVTIDLADRRCNPSCGEGQSCESVCEETTCDASDGPLARCNACTWQCR